MAYLKTGNEENKEDIQLILRRDATYQVNRHQISILKGHEHVVWHVELMPKEENSTILPRIKQFEKEEDAKKWEEKHFKELELKNQRTLHTIYTTYHIEDINQQLGTTRQRSKLKPDMQTKVQKIDTMLKEPNAKIKEAIYVYKNLTAEDLGFTSPFYNKNTHEIDVKQFDALKTSYQYGIHNGYILAELLPGEKQEQEILLKLEVPKGTPLLTIPGQINLLPRGKGIEITNITNKGHYIQIEGKLVEQKEIRNHIEQKEVEMNAVARKQMGIKDANFKVVIYDLTSLYASRIYADTLNVFKQLYSNINNTLLTECIRQMNRDGAFTFVDHSLEEGVYGYYVPSSKRFFIDLTHPEVLKVSHEGTNTILHETGHAFDHLIFKNKTPGLNECSQEAEFINIYINTFLETIFTPAPFKKIEPNDIPQEKENKTKYNEQIVQINQIKMRIKAEYDKLKNHDPNAIRKSLESPIKDFDTFKEDVIIDYLLKNLNIPQKQGKIFLKNKGRINFIETYILKTAAELFAGTFGYIHSPNLKERERIQKEAPDVVKFIENKIKALLNELKTRKENG
ncbi:TPA: hypothetical protein QCU24_005775 [Bacillus cereus]|nr:hypothetical protein [Bacillus cereus]